MRLTVGPLPPAVYWRRRAIVLGGVLVLVMLIVYACSGSGDTDGDSDGGQPDTTAGPTVYPSEDSPSESPSSTVPGDDGDFGDPGGPGEPGGPGDAAGDQPGDGIDAGAGDDVPTCANADLEIKPRPADTQTPVGARLRIDLVISNISDQPCKRDIGADQQEIWLTREGERIWSSDDCNPQQGSYEEVLIPDAPIDKRFYVTWDGKTSAPKCEGDREVAPAGSYSVRARLGNLNSDPVTLKVVAAS